MLNAHNEDRDYYLAMIKQKIADLPEGLEIANYKDPEFLANVKMSLELITPEMAEEWLHRNPTNRKLQEKRVLKNAGAMQDGEWDLNGQTITFDTEDNLVDGQHRLASIVHADMAVWSLVARGLSKEAQETTDTGGIRRLRDMLYRRGESDPALLATTLGWLWRWNNDRIVKGQSFEKVPTIQQGLKTLEEHPGIRDSMTIGRRAGDAIKSGRGVLGMLHYVLSDIDAEDTDEFFARLIDGQALIEGDPIYALRRVMINMAIKSTATKSFASGEYIAAITIKAWNAYRRGDTDVKHLRWRRGGKSPEPFPDPLVDPE